MTSVLTEPTGTGISPPVKPSVWRFGLETFFGYFCTVVVGLPLAIALQRAGLDVFDGASRGIFLRYDVWSWLAEAAAGLLAVWVTAFFVGENLRRRVGWEVPFAFTFVTLLLTGYAPLLALTPLYGATAPVSLVAATLILRWRAEPAGAEPIRTLGAVPRRHRRKVAIGLAIAGPLLFAYVLAYGATHPLRWDYGYAAKTYAHKPGKLMRYELSLRNPGPFQVSDISIVRLDGSPVLQLERVGIEARSWTIPKGKSFRMAPPMRTVESFDRLPDPITLELRQGKACPPGLAKLDAVWVRYTLLDGRHEQRIPVQDSPRVRCP